MADNFAFTEGSGKTGAAKEVAGVLYPEVIQVESDGTVTGVSAKLGSLTETAPASDTALSGLNGRLQRIAQRLTTLIGSTIAVSGTFWQATQPVSEADGANVTLGSKADAKSTATDTTAITAMSVWKQISASVQAIATSIAGTLTVATHAVTQSGTWTVQPGNTANTTAWKVDGSAVTQPVSVASVPSHAVTNAGTFAVQATMADGANTTLGSKADAKSSASDTTSITIMQVLKQISFSIQAAAASLAGTLTVASHAVTNAGTFAVQAASAGDVAHDGADSGNPVKVGGKATNVEPTAVSATGDRTNFITDMVGKQITLPYANPENFVSGAITSAMTGTTSTSLVAAPASGLRNYITTIIVSNAHATVGTDIIIQDGSGGTTLLTIPAAAVYGGAVITLPVPLRQPTTATAIFCANVTSGASTKVSAVGYKGA
jgi:hypothetical protein